MRLSSFFKTAQIVVCKTDNLLFISRYFSYGASIQDCQLQVPCLTHNGAEKRSSLPHHLFIKKPKISANAVFTCFMGTYSGVMTLNDQFLLKKNCTLSKKK